jgi:hypothetical protein
LQILIGLPGQTLNTLRETFKEVSLHKVVLMPYLTELLFASPAATDQSYQDKFNFKYSTSLRYSPFSNSFFRGKIPESCVSFNKKDFVEMVVLTIFYHALISLNEETKKSNLLNLDIEFTVDKFLESTYYKNLVENLLNNWNDDKFYFTINFDGSEKICSACIFEATSAEWLKNKNFIFWLQKTNPTTQIIKSWKSRDPLILSL